MELPTASLATVSWGHQEQRIPNTGGEHPFSTLFSTTLLLPCHSGIQYIIMEDKVYLSPPLIKSETLVRQCGAVTRKCSPACKGNPKTVLTRTLT